MQLLHMTTSCSQRYSFPVYSIFTNLIKNALKFQREQPLKIHNGCVRKSVDFDEYIKIVKSIKDFWFSTSIYCMNRNFL